MLEDDIADVMSKEIAEEIDFEIIRELLVKSCGWTMLVAGADKNTNSMALWCVEQCENKFRHRGRTWLFERAEDAALFKLTWGG